MKVVFFTGAGISAASGMPTFRGKNGIWHEIDAEKVATKKAWYCGRYADCTERRQAVLDFFNPLRRKIMELKPNKAHEVIVDFERFAEVTVITQNGDDYHERAGSTNVIYLHGEALKNCSTLHPYTPIPIDRAHPDIRLGDKAEDGSQIRPFVIFFDEDLDKKLWKKAVEATKEADYFIVVGSSLKVFPAVDLLTMTKKRCKMFVVDTEQVELPEGVLNGRECHTILANAAEGLQLLHDQLHSSIASSI